MDKKIVSVSFLTVAATDMRCFTRSKFLRKKVNFFTAKSLALYGKQCSNQNTDFAMRGRISLLSLNEIGEKLRGTIVLDSFVNKP